MHTTLTYRIASGDAFLAPRPPTKVEKYAAMAQEMGIPFNLKKPLFSMMVVDSVIKRLANRMPDGDPRENNDHDDEGETERTVEDDYDASAGRE